MSQMEIKVIEQVTNNNFEQVLPLIREYQEFYGVEQIDDKKNRLFFSQFTENNINGVLHLYKVNKKAIGFTTIYKGLSSTRAEAIAILNDLFIQPPYRGKGYGKELLDNALNVAKSMGFSRLQWLTAEDNETAQRLYNNFAANKSAWFFYAKET